MEIETLKRKAIRGGIWVFALRAAQQVLTAVRLIILARILAPTDFGLMGICAITIAALDVFSETGFQAALVQRRGDIRRFLDVAWSVSVIRGFILCAILYMIAPYVAAFFQVPQAEAIIKVISLSPLLTAFTNIGIVYFQKNLEFDRQFRYQLVGTASDFAVSITLALATHSVWALVFGLLAGNLARCIASYLFHPYRPRFVLDLKAASELFDFGKWVLGAGVLIFLITQGDNIVVGRLLGVAALGLYQMAYLISNTPATEITQVISQVTFPSYSKIQDNKTHLRQTYLKVLKSTTMLAFPLAAMIYSLAPQFTSLFLGDKWAPMVPVLQLLCLFGAVRAVNATMGPLLQGIGKPKTIAYVSAMQLTLMALLIIPLTSRYDILGTAVAVTIPNIFTLAYLLPKTSKEIESSLGAFAKTLLPAAAGSLIICLTAAIIPTIDAGYSEFAISAILCTAAYFATISIIDPTMYRTLRSQLANAANGGEL